MAHHKYGFDTLKVRAGYDVGDARSLISDSPRTTHGELDHAEQAHAGITPDTIRLSIGLEDPEDLSADLSQAFEAAFRSSARAAQRKAVEQDSAL